ncbi:MAG: hypothetical protein JO168_14435 [Solirubrobacterales bacterium]|nr:hypothetical protein [Solirubrobacterales bacterium]
MSSSSLLRPTSGHLRCDREDGTEPHSNRPNCSSRLLQTVGTGHGKLLAISSYEASFPRLAALTQIDRRNYALNHHL